MTVVLRRNHSSNGTGVNRATRQLATDWITNGCCSR